MKKLIKFRVKIRSSLKSMAGRALKSLYRGAYTKSTPTPFFVSILICTKSCSLSKFQSFYSNLCTLHTTLQKQLFFAIFGRELLSALNIEPMILFHLLHNTQIYIYCYTTFCHWDQIGRFVDYVTN